MTRVRKEVWAITNSPNDKTLFWYAKAVGEMQKRPIDDPTSWRYQAAVHKYIIGSDPLFDKNKDKLPAPQEQTDYWSKCQHNSWFFLPWHRMYLFYFERIALDIIKRLGGPADWALPYWNYSDRRNLRAQTLPPAFRDAKLADGNPNPLYVSQRGPGVNTGEQVGTIEAIDISGCLGKLYFTNEGDNGVVRQFGGRKTGFNHSGGQKGECEVKPHDSMHTAIGGLNPSGWMSSFHTAALDPIFWLHHANIDRLWEVWRNIPGHANPTDGNWLDFSFNFRDANKNPVTLKVRQVLDTKGPSLDYTYQDISNPLPRTRGAVANVLARAARVLETAPEAIDTGERVPEMVGASDTRTEITLGSEPKSIALSLQEPPNVEFFSTRAAISPIFPMEETLPEFFKTPNTIEREVYLNLENITAPDGPIDRYLVYVNLPEGAKAENYPELKAGSLPVFGVVEASSPTREHPGDGIDFSFDITDIVSFLEPQGMWNSDRLHVTFVPETTEAERSGISNFQPVKVGRLSLYYR